MNDYIDRERQDMADALEVCVRRCAETPEFVSEFNRLSGCNFPHGGKKELKRFVGFVGEFVLLPLTAKFLEDSQ